MSAWCTPLSVKALLIETMIEITRIVESNSVIAYMKLENKILTELVSDSVATRPRRKIPARQTKLVSRLKIKNKMIIPINVT